MSPETATYVPLAVYPSPRLPVSPSPLTASICPPGSFSSPSVASHASSITPAAARNAARAPAASYAPPIASGPRVRPSAPSACAAPSVVPCSVGEAYTDTSPLAAGDTTPWHSASATGAAYSTRELCANGTAPIATATPAVPRITSQRSPTRRARPRKTSPCVRAPVIPDTMKKRARAFCCPPNAAAEGGTDHDPEADRRPEQAHCPGPIRGGGGVGDVGLRGGDVAPREPADHARGEQRPVGAGEREEEIAARVEHHGGEQHGAPPHAVGEPAQHGGGEELHERVHAEQRAELEPARAKPLGVIGDNRYHDPESDQVDQDRQENHRDARAGGVHQGYNLHGPPFRGAWHDHLASARHEVRAARARSLLREGRPSRSGGVLLRRPVPGDREQLQPQGRTVMRRSAARRVRDVPLARLGVQRDHRQGAGGLRRGAGAGVRDRGTRRRRVRPNPPDDAPEAHQAHAVAPAREIGRAHV